MSPAALGASHNYVLPFPEVPIDLNFQLMSPHGTRHGITGTAKPFPGPNALFLHARAVYISTTVTDRPLGGCTMALAYIRVDPTLHDGNIVRAYYLGPYYVIGPLCVSAFIVWPVST